MRYWKFKESNRVIAVNCQMSPRWIEISKDEFDKLVLLRSARNENKI
jgi:hypothetical protein